MILQVLAIRDHHLWGAAHGMAHGDFEFFLQFRSNPFKERIEAHRGFDPSQPASQKFVF